MVWLYNGRVLYGWYGGTAVEWYVGGMVVVQ